VAAPFPWPVPSGCSSQPVWNGRGFHVDGRDLSVLCYTVTASGWTEDLTSFHEDTAGPDHFIDRASRRHAIGQVKRHARGPHPVVLEVGCSSGFFLDDLRRELPDAFVIGSDYVRGPLETLARHRPDLPLLQFDLVQCPLPDECVDVVVLLNVLEHIENDVGAVRQLRRILRPGGAVVIEVPAGPHLYDVYDKVLMHYRRYRLGELCRMLEKQGLAVAHASSLGTLLYPGFWYVKRKNKRYLTESEEAQREVVAGAIRKTGRSRLFESVMWVESMLRQAVPLPVGIRCLATGVKKAA
jgi:SAM-dependent methyltransferase